MKSMKFLGILGLAETYGSALLWTLMLDSTYRGAERKKEE